ncbi:MAG: hypothetical protein IJS67_00570, partial [Clostridia bacterium]|nr:hypothetical protein [Clostridia bacterium]
MKEYESFLRVGTEPHRSYYVPFAEGDKAGSVLGITDRRTSSLFTSLDGEWKIKQHPSPDNIDIAEELTETIPVPSCVQMHGFDRIQYINTRYPFPVIFPRVDASDDPTWHYRREIDLEKQADKKYYIIFEGVDSAFYLYVNGKFKGYSQISHATSEFEISDLLVSGKNIIDVVVLKWCISSYLECQDKFRFSGIFRSVYLLTRPENHITDYKIETYFKGDEGVLVFKNESKTGVTLRSGKKTAFACAGKSVEMSFGKVAKWTAESPKLYDLEICASGEKIIEKVGFREVSIEGKVFKINGVPVKLKGVNRHEFNMNTGAAI